MSVINKMLRDLDKQQQKKQGQGSGFVRKQQSAPWLVWLAVPVALALGWLAQSWFVDNQANSGDKKSGKLDPALVAAEMLPELKQSLDHLTKLPGHTGSEVSLTDVATSRMSPEVAEKLSKPAQVSESPAANTDELQSFASQARVEERVVNVTVDDEFSEEALASEDHFSSETVAQQSELVQVGTAELGEPDFIAEEPTVAPAKPRSLAIEKVELTAEQKIQLFTQSARKAESAGDYKKAISHWQDMMTVEPANAVPYLEIARIWQRQRNDAEAQLILERAEVLATRDPRVSVALASLALKQQDWSKMLTHLSYQPDISGAIDFYALKAAALQKNNQHSDAVHTFQQLVRQQPGQARWWLGMALSYDALKQPKEALLAYRQALANGSGLAQDSVSYIKKRIAALE